MIERGTADGLEMGARALGSRLRHARLAVGCARRARRDPARGGRLGAGGGRPEGGRREARGRQPPARAQAAAEKEGPVRRPRRRMRGEGDAAQQGA